MGGAELFTSVDATAYPAEPLAVHETRSSELDANPGPHQPVDRLSVKAFGRFVVAEQRPRPRLDPKSPVGANRLRHLRQLLECCRRGHTPPTANCRLYELGQYPAVVQLLWML